MARGVGILAALSGGRAGGGALPVDSLLFLRRPAPSSSSRPPSSSSSSLSRALRCAGAGAGTGGGGGGEGSVTFALGGPPMAAAVACTCSGFSKLFQTES